MQRNQTAKSHLASRIPVYMLGLILLLSPVMLPTQSQQDNELTLKWILEELSRYQHGGNDDIILSLKDYVFARRNDPQARSRCEQALLKFLDSGATLAAKMEVCRHLRTIGIQESVTILARMLSEEKTSDMARFALENIPGKEADEAFVQELSRGRGRVLLGVVSSIGHRRISRTAPILGEMLKSPDPALKSAVVNALGNIATQDAAEILIAVLPSTSDTLKMQTASALMACAERFQSMGKVAAASEIYDTILASEISRSFHWAALQNKIRASGSKASGLILDILRGEKTEIHAPAIGFIRKAFDNDSIPEVCRRLPGLPPGSQVQLLAVLPDFDHPQALSSAQQLLGSPNEDVRKAALECLGIIGDATTVESLVRHAAASRGMEQAAARSSLGRLRGAEIDPTILDLLDGVADADLQRELIQAVGERRILAGKSRLMMIISQGSRESRTTAIRAVRTLARPSDLPDLLDLLEAAPGDAERQELATTIALVARKHPRSTDRGVMLEMRLARVRTPEIRAALYRALGKIGDSSTLRLLREGLQDQNPIVQDGVIRAFSEWPDPIPKEDVLKIAASTSSQTHQVLTLQAYLRMVGMESFSAPEEAVALLKRALPLIKRSEEKKAFLGMLPRFACREGLEIAESMLPDAAVNAEAEAAVKRIRSRLR